MLTYNNRLKKLVLPEYGRNIQNMVDHCTTIADRDERQLCAETIVNSMLTLFPPTGDADEYRRKLWDHIMIMSDFKLDIDMPYGMVAKETFDEGPAPVPLMRPGKLQFRHYGDIILHLIDTAATMEPGEERDALTNLIANQMKKTLMGDSTEGVDDLRILNDLRYLSHGVLDIDCVRLLEYKHAPTPSGKKKKKK